MLLELSNQDPDTRQWLDLDKTQVQKLLNLVTPSLLIYLYGTHSSAGINLEIATGWNDTLLVITTSYLWKKIINTLMSKIMTRIT